jgi:hypothetical protein
MRVSLVEVPPTDVEVERLRLLLSTFQDGTGQNGGLLPGWRDFERAAAIVFGGIPQESKAIFDVLVPHSVLPALVSGVSCKMRGLLNDVESKGLVSLELSNSAKKFWSALAKYGLTHENYRECPVAAGAAILDEYRSWYVVDQVSTDGRIDLSLSCYLVLQWNNKGKYQLFQLPLALPDAKVLSWSALAGALRAKDCDGKMVYEWYGESGGQLKYYPRVDNCQWKSLQFTLEPLGDAVQYGPLAKASAYFPKLWQKAAPKE